MVSLSKSKIDALGNILGYPFGDLGLLELALTHSSARVANHINLDNERLEFLGDRVLGLVISDVLMERYPQASEGELAKRYNALVRKETCYAVAKKIGLGTFLIMSDSERASGGAQKETILADACEALLGALYKDAGFDRAQKFIIQSWMPFMDNSEGVPADAKSTLQEWAQAHKKALPVYSEVSRTGPDHEPVFTTEVILDGVAPESGTGNSKRIAEHNAAENLLRREKIWK